MDDLDVLKTAQERIDARRDESAIGGVAAHLPELLAERRRLEAEDPEAFARLEQEALDAERAERRAEHEARRLRNRRRALEQAGLDPEAVERIAASEARPPVVEGHAGSKAASDAVVRFVHDDRRTLLLSGPTGHGKSWAAFWALMRPGSMLVSGADIHPGDEWTAMRGRALAAELLVFDDFGTEHASDWHTREAARLVEARQTRALKTIVTTNLDGKSVRQRYGERLLDRFLDRKLGIVVRVEGKGSIRGMVR